MKIGLCLRGAIKYGVSGARGKVSAAFLLLAHPVAAEPITILAFGDSLTQGYGLLEPEGFVPQMRRWLEAQDANVRVINAGVSGDTTAGGAARIEWSLSDDVDAMILTLGGNDVLRGLDPGASRANLQTILSTAKSRDVEILLVGMKAPGNFGPEYKAAFDVIYSDLAQVNDTLFFENFFQGLGSEDPAEARAYFQSDGIHPNAEGVTRIVEAIGPAVLQLVETVRTKKSGAPQ